MVLPLAIQDYSDNILEIINENRHLEPYIKPVHYILGHAIGTYANFLPLNDSIVIVLYG